MLVRLLALFTLLLALLLGGVIAFTRAHTAPSTLDWLLDTGCDLPCWHGITPGETTFAEAMALLQEQPTVQITTSDDAPRLYENNHLINFKVRVGDQTIRAEMITTEPFGHVLYLYFFPLNEAGETWMRLADLVAEFGEPQSVMQDTKNGSYVRFAYGERAVEALNQPWSIFRDPKPCSRLDAQVGILLGKDLGFQPWDRWRGFNKRFDAWCRATR